MHRNELTVEKRKKKENERLHKHQAYFIKI